MSNRFHNKFHRYNHHSTRLSAYGDSGYDPIASKDAPFLGEFVVSSGYISAIDPDGTFSIFTDNLSTDYIDTQSLHSGSISSENLIATSVNILYSLSGMTLLGSDFTDNVPSSIPSSNVLKLSGVGFDTLTWANFQKDVTVGGSLSANIAHLTELSSTTLNVDKLVPQGTHISATSMMVDYISVGQLEGFTTNSVQVKVQEGWDAIETNVCTPRFTAYNDTIYPTTTITDFTTAVEHLVVMNVSAAGYESYGEFEVYSIENSIDTKLGGLKIGNLGLVPNYALEHSEKTGLMINNEQTVSLLVPASCAFKITSLSGFYEAASDSNIRISTTVFQRKYVDIFFENEEFTISKLTINGPLTSTSAIASPLLCTTNIDIINTPLSDSVHMDSIVLSAGSVSVEAANVLSININGTQYFLKLYS